jgi:hypothetical protein
MNNVRKLYTLRARRVAKVMAWLDRGLKLHESRAKSPEYEHMLWRMIDDMGFVELQLKKLTTLVQPVTLDDIDDHLNGNDGRHGDE